LETKGVEPDKTRKYGFAFCGKKVLIQGKIRRKTADGWRKTPIHSAVLWLRGIPE